MGSHKRGLLEWHGNKITENFVKRLERNVKLFSEMKRSKWFYTEAENSVIFECEAFKQTCPNKNLL